MKLNGPRRLKRTVCNRNIGRKRPLTSMIVSTQMTLAKGRLLLDLHPRDRSLWLIRTVHFGPASKFTRCFFSIFRLFSNFGRNWMLGLFSFEPDKKLSCRFSIFSKISFLEVKLNYRKFEFQIRPYVYIADGVAT